jgi:hypothetical protein
MGLESLRNIQVGEEATAGTAVAAEIKLHCHGEFTDERDIRKRMESLGLMLPEAGGFYSPKVLAILDTEGEATYELLPVYFNTCIEDEAGVADGTGGSGYIYTHDIPEKAAKTCNTVTMEWADNTQCFEASYAFVNSFELTWSAGDPVMISANWLGRVWSKVTVTSLSAITTEEIFAPSFYFGAPGTAFNDTIAAGGGLAVKANTLLAYTLSWDAMEAIWAGDGAGATANSGKWFSFNKQRGVIGEGVGRIELTAEMNATGIAMYDAYVAQTKNKFQIIHEGSALASAGDTYTYKTLDIGAFTVFDTAVKVGSQNGNDIMVFSGPLVYDDATDDDAGRIIVVNEKADVYA